MLSLDRTFRIIYPSTRIPEPPLGRSGNAERTLEYLSANPFENPQAALWLPFVSTGPMRRDEERLALAAHYATFSAID